MLCDNCGNSEAIFHLTEISNAGQSELHLCMECAKQINFCSKIEENSLLLNNMFSFLEDNMTDEESIICLNCGLTAAELKKQGKPGCPACYKYFENILSPSYGKTKVKKYSGKRPLHFVEVKERLNPVLISDKVNYQKIESITELEQELKSAVLEERYEDAAILRDRIKEVKAVE